MFKLLFIISIILLGSCTDSTDSQVSGGDFTVHFDNPKDKQIAVKLVEFWKSEHLITSKKQDIKMVRTKSGFDLYLVSTVRKPGDQLSFEELEAISILKKRLENQIFRKESVEIIISDENFKPMFKPDL